MSTQPINGPLVPPPRNSDPAAIGAPRIFQKSYYNVDTLTYPLDLLKDGDEQPYGGNYMVFYINVNEESYLVKNNPGAVVDPELANRNIGSDIRSRGYRQSDITTAVGALGGSSVSALGQLITSGIGSGAVGFVAGRVAGAALVNNLGNVTPQYKQLKKAIALYIPMDLSIRYSANWEEDAMAGSQLAMQVGSNITDFDLKNIASAENRDALSSSGRSVLDFVTGVGLQTPIGRAVSRVSGVAANPKKEQVFNQIDFRTFSFTYQFYPRDEVEAEAVKNIIKEFKLHMHPEIKRDGGPGEFLFIYPSEFDIVYYKDGKENQNIHRHPSCALTDVSVVYTPRGQFNSFRDGMPAQINMTLTFRELAVLTKENIEAGF